MLYTLFILLKLQLVIKVLEFFVLIVFLNDSLNIFDIFRYLGLYPFLPFVRFEFLFFSNTLNIINEFFKVNTFTVSIFKVQIEVRI